VSVVRRFLVIGSNAFSGAQFIKYLLRRGHEVLGVSRSAELPEVFLPYKKLNACELFRFAQIDINHQLGELMALIREFQPEYVVNFAAQGMVAQTYSESRFTPRDADSSNCDGLWLRVAGRPAAREGSRIPCRKPPPPISSI